MHTTTAARLAVPIPHRMRYLRRDARGYPVPHIVTWDRNGVPHFPINDVEKVADVLRRRACAICGRPLEREAWLVGGPKAFLHPRGAFLDPPVHHECGTYAMQVCPFIAAPSYARRIDDRKLKDDAKPAGMTIVEAPGQHDRPPFFILGACTSWKLTGGALRADPPWLAFEVWRGGTRIDGAEGDRLLLDAAAAILADTSDGERRCTICGRMLNTGKPEAVDCGGDCAACMAEAGDPDAQASLRKAWSAT